MHLLAAQPGTIADGTGAVDLAQTPGDIVVLTAADSEIACLAAAQAALAARGAEPVPSLRLANLLHLGHNMSVDLYVESVIAPGEAGRGAGPVAARLVVARLVVARLLGGRGYWPYGVDQLAAVCRRRGIALALLPGDDQPDAELAALSTLGPEALHRMWQYFVHGGVENAANLLRFSGRLIRSEDGADGGAAETGWREPAPLLRAGLYWPGLTRPGLGELRAQWAGRERPGTGAPVAALVFYRALVQAANTAPVDALIGALANAGLNALPVYATSLRDGVAAATVADLVTEAGPSVILNATGFALASPGGDGAGDGAESPFRSADCPVLQVVFAGSGEAEWRDGTRGLSARDIAMNVALPEVDGRVLSRAVSFKDRTRRDELTQAELITYRPVADRVAFVAELAARWVALRRTPLAERRIAFVLANYPNRDGRIGNGVGLDTPAGTVNVLKALKAAGYSLQGEPKDGAALIDRLLAGPTNDRPRGDARTATETLALTDYRAFFSTLAPAVRKAVTARWGPPEADPFFDPGLEPGGAFAVPAFRCGKVTVGLQPARGYNIDPASTYHDPDLVPPHGYFAFYAWLREGFRAHAVVHMGKHGNLEWLPGKALALAATCYPEAALGPVPHLYPFIVNDPGEGTQAKRRAAAIIVDHLTPPLTRAESYGPLRDLEQLVDEYFEAAGLDPRRLKVLGTQILELAGTTGIDLDCGIDGLDDEAAALKKLDGYLCELKEMQIRDGLHVFGDSPRDGQLADLLVALVRVPRGRGQGGDASLTRALGADLGLALDPLEADMAAPWTGARPHVLGDILPPESAWRSFGDTVERLEALARALVAGDAAPDPAWCRTAAVLENLDGTIRPAVEACGGREIEGLAAGLGGRFVAPGPSGAPTRGRPDVLPTGRNFFSLDTRTVPTPAAWQLGWKSATLLVERHAQEHGTFPRRMALSAWGTSNMRTGGDDIAQALALMGVRPVWDAASRRVTGFEILPLSVLDRPRVDVTLRVSGFFRDAFPGLIDLFDSAARAVAELDEPEEMNGLAASVRREAAELAEAGLDGGAARHRAGYRVFGSKPGAYGAGLQALIDERGWDTDADLARAYVSWGGYAYGAGAQGEAQHKLFESRLAQVEAVVHNQDNREHDLLDSDDYYQFEGGLAAAVRHASGRQPALYHTDHSRPESPKVRALEDEVARVVRARVVNPKWIAGVMRHGYKGAFEMAATVDYLFAFAATARAVKDHHFDAVYEAYIGDDEVRRFLEAHNPNALREMSERLIEAQDRGLWRPRSNSARPWLSEIAAGNRLETL
jgi:cobaltochelatase CobN